MSFVSNVNINGFIHYFYVVFLVKIYFNEIKGQAKIQVVIFSNSLLMTAGKWGQWAVYCNRPQRVIITIHNYWLNNFGDFY